MFGYVSDDINCIRSIAWRVSIKHFCSLNVGREILGRLGGLLISSRDSLPCFGCMKSMSTIRDGSCCNGEGTLN